MRVVGFGVLLGLAVGCASAPLKPADLQALARADALVLDGCYDCLIAARDVYERLATGKARPLVITRLFEAQLLLVLRERELALDSAGSFGRARDVARELPPSMEGDRYLAIVSAVPPDNVGTPRRESREFRQTHTAFVPQVNGELAWFKTAVGLRDPVRQYLSLALDCAYLRRPARAVAPTMPAADSWTGSTRPSDLADVPPLVAYRAAICDAVSRTALERVRASVAPFVETSFFVARLEVAIAGALNTGGPKARELLAEAATRFARSPSLAYLTGNYNQIVGNCQAALDGYDRTLAIKSLHEDALLGRTACLSYLRRTDEAIAAATRMIELGTDNVGDAYYWRAWNHHTRDQLEPARADIERAKTLARNERTLTLAGIVEHDQDDLKTSELDLQRAMALNGRGRNCTAMWYLALVKLKQERWLDSAGHFEHAMACYQANVLDDERGLRATQVRTDLEPDFRAAQIARLEAALKEDRSQQHAAAFNAANQSARGGQMEKARTLLEIAANDPALADKVAQLRDLIK